MPDVQRAAPSARTTLAATMRSSRRSLSLKTSPMPPAPIRSIVWKPSNAGQRSGRGDSTAGVDGVAVQRGRQRRGSARRARAAARPGPGGRRTARQRTAVRRASTWCSTKRANSASRSASVPLIGGGSASCSVSAVIARASSIRHASSLLPRRRAISPNGSSSNLRSRMTSRCAGVSDSSAVSSRSACSVEDRLRQRRAARAPGSAASVSSAHLARRVAPLPLLVVGAIADLVLGNLREPRHQRAAVLTFEAPRGARPT